MAGCPKTRNSAAATSPAGLPASRCAEDDEKPGDEACGDEIGDRGDGSGGHDSQQHSVDGEDSRRLLIPRVYVRDAAVQYPLRDVGVETLVAAGGLGECRNARDEEQQQDRRPRTRTHE